VKLGLLRSDWRPSEPPITRIDRGLHYSPALVRDGPVGLAIAIDPGDAMRPDKARAATETLLCRLRSLRLAIVRAGNVLHHRRLQISHNHTGAACGVNPAAALPAAAARRPAAPLARAGGGLEGTGAGSAAAGKPAQTGRD
jgi:hypothetical protein